MILNQKTIIKDAIPLWKNIHKQAVVIAKEAGKKLR